MIPMIPFLFIPDHGPSQPVLHVTPLNVPFIWDENLRVHVHRFASAEDFNTRAPEIIKEERMWKILPGVPIADDEPNKPVLDLESLDDQAIEKEVNRREHRKILVMFGEDPLPPELVAEYARIIGEKSGIPVPAAEASLKIITAREDFNLRHGIGFQVRIGDRFARQAIWLPDFTRLHRGLENKAAFSEAAIQALVGYFRNPDHRLVVDENDLTDHELILQSYLHESGEVTFTIAPISEPPISEPLTGDPTALAALKDDATYQEAVAAAAAAGPEETVFPGADAAPISDLPTPISESADSMTPSEAAATLGNRVPEPADSQAGKVLAAAREKKSKTRK